MTSIVAQLQPHLFQHLNPLQCGLVGRLVPVCPKVLCNPVRLDSPQQWVYTHTDGRYAGRRRRFRSPLKPLESVHGGLLAVKKTIISVSSGSNTKSSDSAQSDLIKSNLNISSLGFPPREELACFFCGITSLNRKQIRFLLARSILFGEAGSWKTFRGMTKWKTFKDGTTVSF